MKKTTSSSPSSIITHDQTLAELRRFVEMFVAGDSRGLDAVKTKAEMALNALFEMVGYWHYFENEFPSEQGRIEAAQRLHGLLHHFIKHFDDLSFRGAEMFHSFSPKLTVWPGFISIDKDIQNRDPKKQCRNQEIIEKLKLGTTSPLNYPVKQWTRGTIGTAIALKLWENVEIQRRGWIAINTPEQRKLRRQWEKEKAALWAKKHPEVAKAMKNRKSNTSPEQRRESELYDQTSKLARGLEPLDRTNWLKWFNAAWPTFLAIYGDEFQEHEKFKHFRNISRQTKYNILKSDDNDPGFKLMPGWRGDVRGVIKKEIKQGFESIARKTNPQES